MTHWGGGGAVSDRFKNHRCKDLCTTTPRLEALILGTKGHSAQGIHGIASEQRYSPKVHTI